MLKLLNSLGYISILSIFFYMIFFIFAFDLFLQIINIALIIVLITINFIFFRKKKYKGIRILFLLIIFFILSLVTYHVYGIIRGNIFKIQINQICDENQNIILNSDEILTYDITYIPDRFIIDTISKGNGMKGYIKLNDSTTYEEISYSSMPSSFGTHPNHYTILYNSHRYNLN